MLRTQKLKPKNNYSQKFVKYLSSANYTWSELLADKEYKESDSSNIKSSNSTRHSWLNLAKKELGVKSFEGEFGYETPEGVVLRPVYSSNDLTTPLTAPEEYPGLYPFKRWVIYILF